MSISCCGNISTSYRDSRAGFERPVATCFMSSLIGSIFEDPEADLKSRHLSDIGLATPSRIRRQRDRRVGRDHRDCRDSGADVTDVSAVTRTAITAVTLLVMSQMLARKASMHSINYRIRFSILILRLLLAMTIFHF